MKLMNRILTFTLTLLLGTSASQAGVKSKIVEKKQNKKNVMRIFLDENYARFETKGDDENQTMIFRKDKGLLWMIDNDKGSYFEISKEMAQQMGGQMSAQMEQAQKMMEESMKEMPKEQQEMMKKFMGDRMKPGKTSYSMEMMTEKNKVEYKKVAENQKISQWNSDKYVGYRHGEKVEELWAAQPGQLGMSEQDFQILHDLKEFMQDLAGEFGKGMNMNFGELYGDEDHPGLPIKKIEYRGDKVVSEQMMQELTKENFSKDLFELPANVERKEMMDMMK